MWDINTAVSSERLQISRCFQARNKRLPLFEEKYKTVFARREIETVLLWRNKKLIVLEKIGDIRGPGSKKKAYA